MRASLLLIIFFLGLQSCKKSPEPTQPTVGSDDEVLAKYLDLPDPAYDYTDIAVPSYLDADFIYSHDNTPANNHITNDIATLGRVLFYDKKLSANNTISCASCHIQEFGFSDTATLSKGFEEGLTGRHSMGLGNARFRTNGKFFWDERAETLEEQVLMPVQDEVEMGMDLEDLVLKLANQPYYPILFKRAFGNTEITSDKMSLAMAQFVRSMLSFNSKYDKGRENHEIADPFSNFTAQENLGKNLFTSLNKGMCSSCHFSDAMITDHARNNGVTIGESDNGVENDTGNPLDRGKFKAPSLRNIAIRPPYMHNGEFTNLRDVVKTYSDGIQWTPTLDAHLMAPGGTSAIQFNLTDEEIDALVAFLNTLTDEDFLTDKKLSDPFI